MIHLSVAATLISFTHLACFAAMSERKYSVKKTALCYLLYIVLFVGVTLIIYPLVGSKSALSMPAAFTVTIITAFFVFMFTSSDAACKKIFLFVSYSNIFCIFQCVAFIVCGLCFPDFSEIDALYAKNILRTLLYIPAIWIYLKFLRPTVRELSGEKKRTWYSVTLVSIIFLAVFAIFVTLCHLGYGSLGWYIPAFAIIFLLYCSVLWVIFGTIRYMNNENKTELISRNMEYLQNQLKIAKENELYAKTIRHDFRHHNQNLAALIKKGDRGEALRYIEHYNDSLNEAKPKEFCPHATVNAVLSSFYSKAQSKQITASFFADTGQDSYVADMDFVAILSNLLENAVNGCVECSSHGEIKVNIRSVGDKTVIVCSNPCKADIEIENNMLKNKGIGIDSVLNAARKYGGDVSYSLENGVITACVILNK